MSPIASATPTQLQPAPPPIESPVASATRTPAQVAPSPSPSANPTLLVNETGHFSFHHPADWVFLNCDPATPGVGFAIWADPTHPVYCAEEACFFTILVTSVSGDHTSDASSAAGCMQYTTGRTAASVKVDGRAALRISDTFTAGSDKTGGFGPDPGTTQVLYAVYDGTRTYLALYQREPNQLDETTLFDDLMQRTFLFLP